MVKGSTLHSRGEVEVGLNWVESGNLKAFSNPLDLFILSFLDKVMLKKIQGALVFECNLAQMIAYWYGI